jgi:hypothetical protein
MSGYLTVTIALGLMCSLIIVTSVVITESHEKNWSPRKTVGISLLGTLVCVLSVVLWPLLVLALVLYIIIAMLANDWAWYKR